MMYGTRKFKSGSRHGYLEFKTGKKVILNNKELTEFEAKIRYWQMIKKGGV